MESTEQPLKVAKVLDNKIKLVVPMSSSQHVIDKCAWVIEIGICDVVVVPDEAYPEAVKAMKGIGHQMKFLTADGNWELV
jgi:hypothetical protein